MDRIMRVTNIAVIGMMSDGSVREIIINNSQLRDIVDVVNVCDEILVSHEDIKTVISWDKEKNKVPYENNASCSTS